jgi:hypothetical protein
MLAWRLGSLEPDDPYRFWHLADTKTVLENVCFRHFGLGLMPAEPELLAVATAAIGEGPRPLTG